MEQKTYTATGTLNSTDQTINLNIALPNPPSPGSFNLTYYNLSKKSETFSKTINVILCQFTYQGDQGNELPTPTSNVFSLALPIDSVKKPSDMPQVADFNFTNNQECLFLFFHSTDANADDRLAFFQDIENLYNEVQSGPCVVCPAPSLRTAPSVTAPTGGRPRALGLSLPK